MAKYQFHVGISGKVDKPNGVIRGVSLITCGIVAKGHDLEVDHKTMIQMLECAEQKGKLPVKLNHQSGVENICGYITNFRIDANKLLGDWHLLKTHREYATTMEKAEEMPGCFGLSVAFQGKGEALGKGRKAARCEELLSADCVTSPAANPDGLFSEKDGELTLVNTGMPNTALTANEPTLAEILTEMKAVRSENAQLAERLQAHEQFLNENFSPEGDDDGLTLDDLDQATDEQLAQLGVTRDQVNAAIAEASAGGEGEGGEGGAGSEGALAGAGASAGGGHESAAGSHGAAGGSQGAGQFAAMQRQITELQQYIKSGQARAETEAEDHAFEVIDSKINALIKENKELKEFNAKLETENAAFKLARKTGVKAIEPGTSGLKFFETNGDGKIHQFQARVKELRDTGKCKTEAEAIRFASGENQALHRDWIMSQSK